MNLSKNTYKKVKFNLSNNKTNILMIDKDFNMDDFYDDIEFIEEQYQDLNDLVLENDEEIIEKIKKYEDDDRDNDHDEYFKKIKKFKDGDDEDIEDITEYDSDDYKRKLSDINSDENPDEKDNDDVYDELDEEYTNEHAYIKFEGKKVKIPVEHKGILEVPEGKEVDELPLSHFIGLVKKHGYDEIARALTNLEVWNKRKNPRLASWAKHVRMQLKERFKKEAFIEDIDDNKGKKIKVKGHIEIIDDGDEDNNINETIEKIKEDLDELLEELNSDGENEIEEKSEEELEAEALFDKDIKKLIVELESDGKNTEEDKDDEINEDDNKKDNEDEDDDLFSDIKEHISKHDEKEDNAEDEEHDDTEINDEEDEDKEGKEKETDEEENDDEDEENNEPEEDNNEEVKSISENYYIINTEVAESVIFNPDSLFDFSIEVAKDWKYFVVKHPLLENFIYTKKMEDGDTIMFIEDTGKYIASEDPINVLSADRFKYKSSEKTLYGIMKDSSNANKKFIKFDFNVGTAEVLNIIPNTDLEDITPAQVVDLFAEYKIARLKSQI